MYHSDGALGYRGVRTGRTAVQYSLTDMPLKAAQMAARLTALGGNQGVKLLFSASASCAT